MLEDADKTYTLASTAWPRRVWAREHEPRKRDNLHVDIEWDGGYCHFSINYIDLGGALAAELTMFDDGWTGFDRYPNFFSFLGREFTSMSNENCRSPEELISVLNDIGFKPSEYHGQLAEEAVTA